MPRILEIVLIDFNEYLKGILQQILASYKILTELNDNPSDLHTMKQEISKIIGLSLVVKNKLEGKNIRMWRNQNVNHLLAKERNDSFEYPIRGCGILKKPFY